MSSSSSCHPLPCLISSGICQYYIQIGIRLARWGCVDRNHTQRNSVSIHGPNSLVFSLYSFLALRKTCLFFPSSREYHKRNFAALELQERGYKQLRLTVSAAGPRLTGVWAYGQTCACPTAKPQATDCGPSEEQLRVTGRSLAASMTCRRLFCLGPSACGGKKSDWRTLCHR
jgi:hypothetical protein